MGGDFHTLLGIGASFDAIAWLQIKPVLWLNNKFNVHMYKTCLIPIFYLTLLHLNVQP